MVSAEAKRNARTVAAGRRLPTSTLAAEGSRPAACVPCQRSVAIEVVWVEHGSRRIDITVDQEVIRVDLFDRTTGVLYEAKASPDRQKIRMAIGQLLDYQRFVTPQPQLRVLVPELPKQDLRRLLAAVGIGVVWPDREGWQEVGPGRPGSVAMS